MMMNNTYLIRIALLLLTLVSSSSFAHNITIDVEKNVHGSINTWSSASAGEVVTVTIMPDGEYTYVLLYVNGESHQVEADDYGNYTYTLSMPDRDVTLYTVCKKPIAVTLRQDPKNTAYYYGTWYDGTYSYEAAEDVEVWYAQTVSDGIICLEKSTDNIIYNGCGVILRSTTAEIKLFDYDNTGNVTKESALKGTSSQMMPDYTSNDYYVLSHDETHGVAFYKLASGNTIPANKAYYEVSKSGAARTALTFDFSNTPAGINETDHTADSRLLPSSEGTYTLQGTPVSPDALVKNRVYIVKGRKAFVK